MKRIIKVDAKGKKTKKLVCPDGKKAQDGKCVTMSSKEKLARKIGIRHAVKTKKAEQSKMKMANRARLRALKKRKNMGL